LPGLLELEAPAEAQPHARVKFVAAPLARQLVVSDPAGALLLVNDLEQAEHHLSVVPLNAQCEPAAARSAHADLPLPAPLAAARQRVLAIQVHPDKPVVYLWRDLVSSDEKPLDADTVYAHFNHLLVYRITDDHKLELVQRTARGRTY